MQKGETDAAVTVYRDLTQRDPRNGMAFHNLGLALKQKDVHVEAEAALRRAAELTPTLPDPTYTLAVLLWQTNRPSDAAEAARETIRRAPEHGEAHYLLGTVLRQLGDLDGAISEFRETIRIQPRSAEAQMSLGQALQRKRDREGSAAAMAKADELNRKKVDYQAAAFAIDLGKRMLAEVDVAGAVAKLTEATRLAPEMADAHYQLAVALERKGSAVEAKREFDEARRLAPYLIPPPSSARTTAIRPPQ